MFPPIESHAAEIGGKFYGGQKFEVPITGIYRITCHSPAGSGSKIACGISPWSHGGYGSRTSFDVHLTKGQVIQFACGKTPEDQTDNNPETYDPNSDVKEVWCSGITAEPTIVYLQSKDPENPLYAFAICKGGTAGSSNCHHDGSDHADDGVPQPGWYDSKICSNIEETLGCYSPEDIKGGWVDIELKGNSITYDANGGTGAASENQIPFGANPYTLHDGAGFSRKDHVLLGWSTNSKATTPQYELGETVTNFIGEYDSIILYAVWAKEWYIQYNNQNGSSGTVPKQIVQYNSYANLSNGTELSLRHSTLMGWSKSANPPRVINPKVDYALGQRVYNEVKPGSTLNLYAVWRPWWYRVTYHNNIPGQPDVTTSRNDAPYEYDVPSKPLTANEASAISGFTREGYYIDRWSIKPNLVGSGYTSYHSNSTGGQPTFTNLAQDGQTAQLYAIWKGNPYKLYIHDNYQDCKCAVEVYNLRVGESFTLQNVTNKHRSNAKLLGYSASPDYTETPEYKPGDSMIDLTKTSGGEVHLYRIWDNPPTVQSPKHLSINREQAQAAGIVFNSDGTVKQSDLELLLMSYATAQDYEYTKQYYTDNIPAGSHHGYTFKISSIDAVDIKDNLSGGTCNYVITYMVTDSVGNSATSVTELLFGTPGSDTSGWITILTGTN